MEYDENYARAEGFEDLIKRVVYLIPYSFSIDR